MPSAYTGNNRVLAALSAEDFSRFFLTLELVDLPLRQIIQDAAQAVEYIYFVESGVASILTIMSDGSAIEVGMTGTEGMIGVGALLDPKAIAQHVIVQIPGMARRMPIGHCKTAFEVSADVRSVMLQFASSLLALSTQTAACNRLHSIEQRCARWLLMAYDRIGTETMPMTHEFLASMLGVRRAGVTTAAGELPRSDLINYRQGSLTIRDPEGLQALACECHRADRARLNQLF